MLRLHHLAPSQCMPLAEIWAAGHKVSIMASPTTKVSLVDHLNARTMWFSRETHCHAYCTFCRHTSIAQTHYVLSCDHLSTLSSFTTLQFVHFAHSFKPFHSKSNIGPHLSSWMQMIHLSQNILSYISF